MENLSRSGPWNKVFFFCSLNSESPFLFQFWKTNQNRIYAQ